MQGAIWRRIRTIYSHQIFLIVLFVLATFLFVLRGADAPGVLSRYADEPILFPIFSVFLVSGSSHMGILPMYIFFMMLTPMALRMLNAGKYLSYAALVTASWMLAQTRIPDLIVHSLEGVLLGYGHELNLGIFFNVFGWQALFFAGLAIGFLMASKRLNLDFLATVDMRGVFYICAALVVLFGIFDRIVFDDWFGAAFSDQIKAETDRGNFSTIYLVAFVVDLIVVIYLLGPGLSSGNGLVKGTATVLLRVVNFRPLVFLGQHSLHVFTAHLVIYYVFAVIFEGNPPSEVVGILLLVASIAVLYLVAWLHAKANEASKKRSLQKA